MANIKINNLNPAGSDLFADPESFMTELSNEEMMMQGGMTPVLVSVFFTILIVRGCGCTG